MTPAPLKLSHDRKVAPLSRWAPAASRWEPKVPNSFGLPPVITCPGSTAVCRAACYATRIPWPSAHALLEHNLETLRAAGTEIGQTDLIDEMIARYLARHRRVCGDAEPHFRVHWSGDYFDATYAAAWRRVIDANPTIRFWSYTRSFDLVPILAGSPNHALYVSADDENGAAAQATADRYGLPVATMTTRGRPRGSITCPVDAGNRPMVNDDGVGACESCRLCIVGERPIHFPTR